MDEKEEKLEPLVEKEFFEYWNAHKPVGETRTPHLLKYFKRYIDILPKTAIGNYYWQIYSIKDPIILFAGGDVPGLTPYSKDELTGMTPAGMFDLFHPEEVNHIFAFIAKFSSQLLHLSLAEREELSCTIYCRIKNRNGDFVWNSIQYPAFYYNQQGEILFGLAVYTNVSHVVKENAQPMMTLLDNSKKNMQVFTCHYSFGKSAGLVTRSAMTKREKEVFNLLILGLASKEIAWQLGIAKSTVDNHRQALLRKFNAASTAELVSKVADHR